MRRSAAWDCSEAEIYPIGQVFHAPMSGLIIGRAPDCGLGRQPCLRVVAPCLNSARGAQGQIRLRDEGSANGTFINQPNNEIRETDLRDDDIVLFSEAYKVPGSLLLKKFLAWEASGGQTQSALAHGQVNRFTEENVTLGSDADNLVVLPYLDVWPQHVVIVRDPTGGYVLHDLGGGCTVNGERVVGAAVALQPNAAIEIGGVTAIIENLQTELCSVFAKGLAPTPAPIEISSNSKNEPQRGVTTVVLS